MKLYVFILLILISLLVGWLTTTGVKSQFVRLGDILLYGPFLIWVATMIEETWIKVILIIMGGTTIAYNARNWFSER